MSTSPQSSASTLSKNFAPMSETFRVGLLLAMAGGFLDTYTYLWHGHVFANAQTGNIVFLGIYLAEGNVVQALRYIFPILAFIIGIVMAEGIKHLGRRLQHFHWRQIVLLFEIGVLLFCAQFAGGEQDGLVTIAISFVCSLQVQAFRKVHGNTFATTMCTGNLRSATEAILAYHQTHDRSLLQKGLHYFGIILFFLIGATLGVASGHWLGDRSLGIPITLLAFACLLLFIKTNED